MLRGQAVINVPLADTFKVRLAVDRQKRDGYMHKRTGIGPDRYNDTNYFAARLGILADLTPNLENYMVTSTIPIRSCICGNGR
jgi:iron complex outermembrane receptor protein